MPTQLEKRFYTREEYLTLEEAAEFKSEYFNGEIVPMGGSTTNHNHIIVNLVAHLKFALKGQNYNLFTSDIRLWIDRYHLYTYPDIMLIQGQPVYEGTGTTTVRNPLIVIEVLSKSTQAFDKQNLGMIYGIMNRRVRRGHREKRVLEGFCVSHNQLEKFKYYRSIPEFKEYILIDQYRFYIEQFSKNSEGKWMLTEYESADGVLRIAGINYQISLSDIYEQVNLE